MSYPLYSGSDKRAIFDRVVYLIEECHEELHSACKIIEKETGQKWGTTKRQYCRTRTGAAKAHGRCKLTLEQDNILLSILIVFSSMHEALSTNQIIQAVQELFEVEVSRHWVTDFEKRHKDELTKKKAKLLDRKSVV